MSKLPYHVGYFHLEEPGWEDIWLENFGLQGQIAIITNPVFYDSPGLTSASEIIPIKYQLLALSEVLSSDEVAGSESEMVNQFSGNLSLCWEMSANAFSPFLQRCLLETWVCNNPVLALQENHSDYEYHKKEQEEVDERRLNMQGKGLSDPEPPFNGQKWWDELPPEERAGWDSLYDRD